jgi:hypothetical protein
VLPSSGEESSTLGFGTAPVKILILGGLLSSTALNMLVLPALYWLWGEREAWQNGVVRLSSLRPTWP